MKRYLMAAICWLLCLLLVTGSAAAQEGTLRVNPADGQAEMSDTLYGLFFEDINHAADGGLYAELLNNRSFEYENLLNPQRFDHYTGWSFRFLSTGKGKIALMDEEPLHANNPHYVRVTVQESGYTVSNGGYGATAIAGGIPLSGGAAYDVSLYLRSRGYAGTVTAVLCLRTGEPLSDTMSFTPGEDWGKHTGTLTALPEAEGKQAFLLLTFGGTGEVELDMASLMPQERFGSDWPGGGLRSDLVAAMAALHPSFLRFPGGCVAEGSYYRSNFYNWKDTVGPVEQRKENYNTWGYMQSYGLGYYEYFCLSEAIGALPLPVVHAGLLCQARETLEAPIPMAELDAYVQDVLDLIEFARGGTDTTWGALRAEMGHPEPFDLRYLAIGNENWGDVYFNRYDVISKAVKAAWPDITTIVAAGPVADNGASWSAIRARFPDSMVDEHYYMDSDWFPAHVKRYDTYSRATKVFLGEYAAHEEAVSGKRPNNLYSALCEAAYLTGIERNSDVVSMCCYAPLLAREGMQQWTPDLIWFNATQVLLTPNYYVQQMFAATAGEQVVGSEWNGSSDVYQVATRKGSTLYVKLVNLSGEACEVKLELPGVPDGTGTVKLLTGEPHAQNTFAAPEQVVPTESACQVADEQLTAEVPAYAVCIWSLALE
ncbi:MAG: alpha-L-arabinofuranosidase C-terminal domain-containing protein [Aristaeellaceae bacterium]